jgi:adenylate cyclase class IV
MYKKIGVFVGYKNREIELKLLAKNIKSIEDVAKKIEKVFNYKKTVCGKSKDVYWDPIKGCKADFVRLRNYPESWPEVTVKYTDRGSNFDRVEIDLSVESSKNATEIMKSLLGNPRGSITKEYQVYFLDDKDTNISVYKIEKDSRIFIEIEARTKKKVLEVKNSLLKYIPELELSVIEKSLYEIFLNKKKS